jgi:hypothetical protein
MEEYDVAYLEATATKYICRWDLKGTPALDLGKGVSYLQKMLRNGRGTRRLVPDAALTEFCDIIQADMVKRALLRLVLVFGEEVSIHAAVVQMQRMVLTLGTQA